MAKRKQTWSEMTAFSTKGANWILKNLTFVLFLALVLLTYIANSRYAQSNIREIEAMQDDMKEYHRVYNALKAEVMNSSKKEEISKMVAPMGLKLSSSAPKKIVVKNIKNYEKE